MVLKEKTKLAEARKQIKDLRERLEAKEWMKNLLTDCLETRAEKAEEERDYWKGLAQGVTVK